MEFAMKNLQLGTNFNLRPCVSTTSKACEIPRLVLKTVNNFFHYGLHLRPKKSNTNSGDDVRTMCCYFLGRKSKQL